MAMGAGPGQQPATKDVYRALSSQMMMKDYHGFIMNGDISYARVSRTRGIAGATNGPRGRAAAAQEGLGAGGDSCRWQARPRSP